MDAPGRHPLESRTTSMHMTIPQMTLTSHFTWGATQCNMTGEEP